MTRTIPTTRYSGSEDARVGARAGAPGPGPVLAAARIELGKRACQAIEAENPPGAGAGTDLGSGGRTDLGATLAAYAAVCQRADQARRRAAIAHFADQLRRRRWVP